MVKPGDLNPLNTLFGGRLLEWVDIVFVVLNSRGKPIVHRLARRESGGIEPVWARAKWPAWLSRSRQRTSDTA